MAKRKVRVDKSNWTPAQLCASYKNPYSQDLSMRQMISNSIRVGSNDYNGGD
jgi:hypothetical protein